MDLVGNTAAAGLAAMGLVLGLGGCTLLNPAFEFDTESEGFADGDDLIGEGGDADADGTGPDPCGDRARCFVPPGPDWQGPVAIFKGADDQNVGCGGAFDDRLWTGLYGPQGDPLICEACSCNGEARELLACKNLDLQLHAAASCQDPTPSLVPLDPSSSNAACANVDGPQGGLFDGSVRVLPGDADGRCGALGGDVSDVPSVGVEGQVTVCGGGKDVGACPDTEGRCIEVAEGASVASVCVFTPGDVACPAGYPDKHLYGQTLVDERYCSACACGLVNGRCTADLQLWGQKDCAGQEPLETVEGGSCAEGTANGFASASLSDPYLLDGGSCVAEPSGGQPQGEVVLGDTATVCCVG